ncbi:hypothetical protein DFQ05_2183 [Winogradskyella wandonensis]|uniref:Uncharacterized protein n=1 Tax=Winogradskyella wandonensis TaxID=1442586 RepID=A0A4R1KQX8_9FLAO|nr:DUF6498-containing protein [Winogradskyella wandonensis]TCK66897.1 hypothetical protein DFQ05_2183 [Winogradskyella wandonensis]
MLKSVFIPNKANSYAWVNLLFIIFLVAIDKIEAHAVLFGYFLETIIIGVFNIFKMYLCRNTYIEDNEKNDSIWFLIPFFVVHYGGFVAIQSIFLFAIFSISGNGFIKEPFNLIDNFNALLQLEGMLLMLLVLTVSQLLKFYFDFLKIEKFHQFTANEVMFKPYLRIFIQQFVVIIGSFFMMLSGAPIFAAILLILLRFVVDFLLVAIRENSHVLDYLVNKLHDGKVDKSTLRRQLLLFSE